MAVLSRAAVNGRYSMCGNQGRGLCMACSLITGMIAGNNIAMGAPALHVLPSPPCLSGFTRSAGPTGNQNYAITGVYTCTSGPVGCSRDLRSGQMYFVVNHIGMPNEPFYQGYSPHYEPNPNYNSNDPTGGGVFVYRCNTFRE